MSFNIMPENRATFFLPHTSIDLIFCFFCAELTPGLSTCLPLTTTPAKRYYTQISPAVLVGQARGGDVIKGHGDDFLCLLTAAFKLHPTKALQTAKQQD